MLMSSTWQQEPTKKTTLEGKQKRASSERFVRLNYQPHKGQLGGKNEQKKREQHGQGQRYGCCRPNKGKNMREKHSRNNAKQKNECTKKGLISKSPWCVPINERMTNKSFEGE